MSDDISGCVRGCVQPGGHFANCASFGPTGDDSCTGCVPVPRADGHGSLLCRRCASRVKSLLDATPDLLAHIRTLVDPMKATQYDKEPTSGGSGKTAPPPVPVELLDAGDEVMTILWRGLRTLETGEVPSGRVTITPGTEAPEIHDWSRDLVDSLLDRFDEFAAIELIGPFADVVLEAPANPDGWTIAKAMRRWSLQDKPWWAAQPCPIASCGLRAVKVTPPAVPGEATSYRCESCKWEASAADLEICAAVFTKREGKAACRRSN